MTSGQKISLLVKSVHASSPNDPGDFKYYVVYTATTLSHLVRSTNQGHEATRSVTSVAVSSQAALCNLSTAGVPPMTVDGVKWVLTVPASLPEQQQEIMRSAAVMSSLVDDGHDDEVRLQRMSPRGGPKR